MINAENDEAIPPQESKDLQQWTNGKLISIPDTGHTFGTKQPSESKLLAKPLAMACSYIEKFIVK